MALETSFGCEISERGGVPLLQWPAWLREGAPHGITTRHGGVSREPYASLNLGDHVGDVPGAVAANRAKLGAALGDMRRPRVFVRQVHGGDVRVVTQPPAPGEEPPEADALFTDRTDVFLALCFADCMPVLFFDPVQRAVGVAHAGWRGLQGGILENTVRAMTEAFGTDPKTLQAAIGPHIGVCCYEVGDDVAKHFEDVPRAVRTDEQGRKFLNLTRVARRQLDGAGLNPEHVNISAPCTSCFVDAYFSHRAEGGRTGRFAAIIGLEEAPGVVNVPPPPRTSGPARAERPAPPSGAETPDSILQAIRDAVLDTRAAPTREGRDLEREEPGE
jgi:YfiH family protein